MVKEKQRRARRAFTAEFEAEAVRLCRVRDRTITQAAEGIGPDRDCDWVKRADIDAARAAGTLTNSGERRWLDWTLKINRSPWILTS
jgi:transposase